MRINIFSAKAAIVAMAVAVSGSVEALHIQNDLGLGVEVDGVQQQ